MWHTDKDRDIWYTDKDKDVCHEKYNIKCLYAISEKGLKIPKG
jgi:hypothetical protein